MSLEYGNRAMKMLFITLNIKLFPKVTRSMLQLRASRLLADDAIKNIR